ncbi:hypothetical protein ACI6QG_19405, partial [Roseococcus sp. DSY-14]
PPGPDRAPRPEGERPPRPEGERGFRGPRADGPPRGPRRDDRGPRRDDRFQKGGPETRTFHEDKPATAAEDSPFAALLKLKLGK